MKSEVASTGINTGISCNSEYQEKETVFNCPVFYRFQQMVTAEVKEEVETALSVTLAAVDHQDASEVDQLTNQLITKEKLLHEMTQAMMAGDKKQRELQETVDRLNAQLETEKKQLVLLKKKFLALKKKQWVNSLLL